MKRGEIHKEMRLSSATRSSNSFHDEPMAPQFIRAGDDSYYLITKFGALSFDVKGSYMKKNMPSKYVFIGANIREEVKKYAATLMGKHVEALSDYG